MNTQQTCQQCGAPISAAANGPFGDQGVCPTCLLGLGMSDQQATQAGSNSASAQFVRSKAKYQIPDVDQLIGKFPNLEIQHLIGYGGMGAVYQARQISLDRNVALKILSPRLSQDQAFAQRFMREAKTLARLAHPNIVMVFEFGQTAQMHYLLMEYVDGINLRDAIVEGKLTASEALAIVPQICDALQYAHDEGVVHRDIKPENILIDKKGRVKIADFGLAKLLQPNADDYPLTGTQQVLGTLNYMAPEQIEGRANIDHRADIYSLGVVFYELLTGELPIGRFAVPSEKGKCDSKLDDIVLRTLEKEPDRRYQNASDVKSAVQNTSMAGLPTSMQIASQSGVQLISDTLNRNPLNASSDRSMKVAAHDLHRRTPGINPAGTPQLSAEPVCNQQPMADAFNRPLGQAASPPSAPTHLANAQSRISVPFTIDQVYGGFAMAHGIMTLDNYGLEIEFEIRDEVLRTIKSKSKKIQIPLEAVAALEHKKGIFSDRILVQTNSLSACSEVPNSNSGNFKINVQKIHRDQAALLTIFATAAIAGNTNQAMPTPSLKPAPINTANDTSTWTNILDNFNWIRHWQPQVGKINPIKISSRFSSVRFWFITCGVLNFVMLGGSLRRIIHDALVENLEQHQQSFLFPTVMWLQSIELVANPFSSAFTNGWSGWIVPFSITLFVAAGKLDELKSYIFVCLICAWALIPFYPTYLLCAPWALWGLLIMLMPSTITTFDFVGKDGSLQPQPLDINGKPIDDSGEGILSHRSQTFISRFLFAWIVLGLSLLITSGLVYSKILNASGNNSSVTKQKEEPSSSQSKKETIQSSNGENSDSNAVSESQSAPTTAQESEEKSKATTQPNPETPKPPTASTNSPQSKASETKTDIDDQNLSVDSLGSKGTAEL